MHQLPARIGLIGDVHGNSGISARAIRRLTMAGATELHFLGDFGFLWDGSERQTFLLDALNKLLERDLEGAAFVTGGNHENYDEWEKVPADADGVRWVRSKIALLPRGWRATSPKGQVFASLGGANSIDKPARLRRGVGWWPQESITEADLEVLGTDPVDVLLGHDAPMSRTLIERLAPNAQHWEPEGLLYAELGHAMFQRGVEQVRPKLTFGGHYHLHVDVEERFETPDGQAFTTRVVVLNADGHKPTIAALDTNSLTLDYPRFGQQE